MGDKNKGLYGKFAVQRMDGSDQPGGKHHGCEYFVLDLSHDPHAEPALRAYAFSCRHEYPLLSDDLREKAQSMRESGASRGQLRNIDSRVEITLRQALALVDFFGGSDAEITIQYFGPGEMKTELGEECPAGIYAWCSDYPDEGACYLGPTEVADDDSETEIGYFDLVAHLRRQREFSLRTFGPGARTDGVLDHIRKELGEISSNPGDVTEWVDVILLAMDGAWRAGFEPEQIARAISSKQARNESRKWPDWRNADPSKAIEHVREEGT